MAKVLLIRPKSRIPITNFPLGLMYLAAYLEKTGHQASILDLRFPDSSLSEITEKITQFKPDIVGIGAMTTEDAGLREVLSRIKDLADKPLVVVGGPHTSTYLDRIMRYTGVDCAVIQEGEETLSELAAGKLLPDILGLAYKKTTSSYQSNRLRSFMEDLDQIPYPAYHLLDTERYFRNPFVHGFVLHNLRHAQIMSSRGCPYSCIFCHAIFGKKFRGRSPENVYGEIRFLYERYGVKDIHFEDDSFNLDRLRAEKILDLIINSGLKIKISFPNGLRADLLDKNFIDKMKKAGVYQVSVGIESADPQVQQQLGKNANLKKISWAVKEMARRNIITDGFFMLGFLNENKEQMLRTISFARRSALHLATVHKVNPFPGTVLGRQAQVKGYHIDICDFGEDGYRFGRVNISAVSQRELDRMQRKAYLLFYAKFSRLFKIFRLTPNKRTIFRHFLRLVFWR